MVTASNDADYTDSNKFFEYWSNLFKTDHLRFETERKEEIEKVISRAPAMRQQELRQLQWIIDGERRRAKNPVDSMLRLNKMMLKQFYAEKGFVFAVKQLVNVCHHVEKLIETTVPKNAEILLFKND